MIPIRSDLQNFPRIVATGSDWVRQCSAQIASSVSESLEAFGRCNFMLTGGNSVQPIYRALAVMPEMRSGNVKYYFGDERCVPPDHPESNYRSACEVLFPGGIPSIVDVYRMRGEDLNPSLAATDYECILPERIDVLLLSVGMDGHIASLFPRGDAISEFTRKVVPVRHGESLRSRLTVTPEVIRQARLVYVLAKGEAKGRVLARAMRLGSKEFDFPVRIAMNGYWMLDQVATNAMFRET